ncbi:MAG: Xaa-Pro peptidase family protein [Anaerolineaceae bacterium]|nr:Xaa-Pro peptidase family protein [Anaerolineaceae bacterium]
MEETLVGVPIGIPAAEYRRRQERLRAACSAQGAGAACVFDADYVKYYSGFFYSITERPLAFVMNAQGETALFVPRLEQEHARTHGCVDEVWSYPEYPGLTHPMAILAERLRDWGVREDALLADEDGYPWVLGYRGPALSELLAGSVLPARAFIEDCLNVKSDLETDLLRHSAIWGNYGLARLVAHTRPARTETMASQRATAETWQAMLAAYGPHYQAHTPYYGDGARVEYRGQIGRNSAIPHAIGNNLTFQEGDTLIGESTVAVWGYSVELERTLFLGAPGEAQRFLFRHMLALQETAIAAIQPGQPCSIVDEAVRAYFIEHDLERYRRHHVGHGIGLRYHEGPFLDVGDHTLMQPGMVFTVEPGLFDANWGGFRHSDTVRVTDSGNELLTLYPRDLESCTLPVVER